MTVVSSRVVSTVVLVAMDVIAHQAVDLARLLQEVRVRFSLERSHIGFDNLRWRWEMSVSVLKK